MYGLGSLGVNVDKNPIQLEDGELTKAQNTIHDPTGSMGGIRKRPGLTKVNASALTGSVFGIINVPIAPITVRKFLIGLDQDVTSSAQWISSVDEFGNTTTATSPAACARPAEAFLGFNSVNILTNRGCQTETLFLYPGDYTRGAPQPIRAFDTSVDLELFTVPLNPKTISDQGLSDYALRVGCIPNMKLVGNKLYFVSIDWVKAGTGAYSRVFEYDFDSGSLAQIGQMCSGWDNDVCASSVAGTTGPASQAFRCIEFHQGYLYAGVGHVDDGTNSTGSGVYRIRPGIETEWTYDFDNSGAADADLEAAVCMASYKGKLYVGMHDRNSTTARVMVRGSDGSYSQSTTAGNGNGSVWADMLVFGDNLYACHLDNNGASSITTIRKFDGSSWSTVKTIDSATATPRCGVAMAVHNGRLYVLCINSAQDGLVTHTADGSSWTDQTSNLTNNDLVSIFGVVTD